MLDARAISSCCHLEETVHAAIGDESDTDFWGDHKFQDPDLCSSEFNSPEHENLSRQDGDDVT